MSILTAALVIVLCLGGGTELLILLLLGIGWLLDPELRADFHKTESPSTSSY